MAAMIDYVMKPFRQLNISTTEFATLQAIMFFDPDTDGIDSASQRNVAAEQKKLLTALHRHIQRHYTGSLVHERFANILLRIPTIRKVAAKKNESLQMIDMFELIRVEFFGQRNCSRFSITKLKHPIFRHHHKWRLSFRVKCPSPSPFSCSSEVS
ncbi:Nuclear hormone receptor member nhr-47 [Parelaphostrongylus tenuis]|uniref:Nuclear hormone receptor member nhr-47 n=1 Tax=Parelaphostrongylus tenuis TaxID=148309 RepID=A0AAD5MRP5_PARTN|nr:Nuclear hormone receptor member nhr-47 [Parelaphostrongylus tenuis]